MGRFNRYLGVVACVAVLGACSSGSAAPASNARLLNGRPMTACTLGEDLPGSPSIAAQCGTLKVPEDRSKPTGRQIGLHVALVPAEASTPAPDAFFALAGGPGEVGTQHFTWLPDLFWQVHATRDIVFIDQRGTGGSHELVLPAPPDTSGLAAAEADARLSGWAKNALASLEADPRQYTSTVAADDIDAVRAALGYDTIDLYGPSYGGTLAQYYLRQHPDHVRVAVLDSATPLDVPIFEQVAANSQHALDLLLTRCEDDPACHAALPNVAAEWSTVEAALAQGVTVTDPTTGNQGVADLATVGPAIHHALTDASTAMQLPLAIHLASESKWEQVSQLIGTTMSDVPGTLVIADEIRCSEAWARFDPSVVERLGAGSYALESELVGARAWAALCRYLPKGVVSSDDAAPVRTQVPVLWLAADGDPQDPPANLADVPAQEPNSAIVVMAVQNHTVGHLGCLPSVIGAFVDAGTTQSLDTSCVAQGPLYTPSFQLP